MITSQILIKNLETTIQSRGAYYIPVNDQVKLEELDKALDVILKIYGIQPIQLSDIR